MNVRAFKRAERTARWLLAPLIALALMVAIVAPWGAAWSVDNRTMVEMIDGVRRHGLPYTQNGDDLDPARYPEVRAPFNVPSHGKLWGEYPPLYAYVAAPALALGGVPWVSKLNALLIGVLAITTYLLARRVLRDPLGAVAASYLVVLASPAWAGNFETLPQPLMLVLLTSMCLAGVRTIETRRTRTFSFAFVAGALGGLAIATHLVAFPMVLALITAIAIVRDPAVAGNTWVPDRLASLRASAALVGLAAILVPMGLLNSVRFGTLNPISYGPCVWAQCTQKMEGGASSASLLAFVAPTLPWFLGVFVAWLWAPRSMRARATVLGVAALVLVVTPAVGDRVLAMLRTAYGYLIDVSPMDFSVSNAGVVSFTVPPDGLGIIKEDAAIKSLWQSAPFLALAPLAAFGRRGARARALVLGMPVLGLVAMLGLLARYPGAHAFGWPFLFLRYAIPAAPLLAVLSVAAVRDLPWRRAHLIAVAIVAVLGIVFFVQRAEDSSLVRRIFELRLTLLAASVAIGLVLWARRTARAKWIAAATTACAVCAGLAVAVSVGVDDWTSLDHARVLEKRRARLDELTPQKFALAGWGADTDPLLTLRTTKDIEYIDLVESKDWRNFREIMDVWAKEGRPLFAAFPRNGKFAWPYADWDVPGVLLDEENGLWRLGPPKIPAPPR